ncbi:MAG: hypothetical protein WAL84_09795 [Candidatus Dormiibacterota bacterium]
MTALAWLGFALGLVLVLTTYASVVETTILPRGTQSGFSALVLRSVSFPIRVAASMVRDFEARDRLLAYSAALFLVLTLLAWLLLFLVGFTLILWPFSANIGDALRVAGSSMLTLGIAAPSGSGPLVIVYLAALTGLVVIALQIAYLPVLYAAYNRRETLVTMLEGLAGTPGWGPEILMRTAAVDNLAGLGGIYDRWMEWAADVSESHSAYRVLLYFRSPVSRRSWVISLLSILDCGAMHLALCPVTVPAQARNMMRVGYLAFRQLSASIGHPVPDDPGPDDPIQLTHDEFIAGAEHARAGGVEFEREPEAAWPHFRGWRANYEEAAYALAAELDVVPALWSGPRPRPGPSLPPIRPVDRVSATAEVTEIQRVRELRRQRRLEQERHSHTE